MKWTVRFCMVRIRQKKKPSGFQIPTPVTDQISRWYGPHNPPWSTYSLLMCHAIRVSSRTQDFIYLIVSFFPNLITLKNYLFFKILFVRFDFFNSNVICPNVKKNKKDRESLFRTKHPIFSFIKFLFSGKL